MSKEPDSKIPHSLQNSPTTKRVSTSSSATSSRDHNRMADYIISESSSTSPPPSIKCDVFSSFGKQECGEPWKPQQLVIDFSPDPETDTEESQQKCISFWDFIESQPFLDSMFVEPEAGFEHRAAAKPTTPRKPQVPSDTPAQDVLQKDTYNIIELACRQQQAFCGFSEDHVSYVHDDPIYRGKIATGPEKWTGPVSMCTCSSSCPTCSKSKKKPQQSSEPVRKLNKILDEWDEKHPKSMEPPGPIMQYKPIMQRLPHNEDKKIKTCLD